MYLKVVATNPKPKKLPFISVKNYNAPKHNRSILSTLQREPAQRIKNRYLGIESPQTILATFVTSPPLVGVVLWDSIRGRVCGWGELYEIPHKPDNAPLEMCRFIARPYANKGVGTKLGIFLINYAHQKLNRDVYTCVGLNNVGSLKSNQKLCAIFPHEIKTHNESSDYHFLKYVYPCQTPQLELAFDPETQ